MEGIVAKVSVRDALLADLLARYPTKSLSLSDRILKLITEVDTLRGLVGATSPTQPGPANPEETPTHEEESPANAVVGEMLNTLAKNVNVGESS